MYNASILSFEPSSLVQDVQDSSNTGKESAHASASRRKSRREKRSRRQPDIAEGVEETKKGWEDNELKVGRFLPGTALEIKHSSCLETARPDIIIVFAWNFYDDIIKKLQRKLSYEPEIICPLPELIRYKLNWKT